MSHAKRFVIWAVGLALAAVPAAALSWAAGEGYIDRQTFDVTAVLPPAPLAGSDRYEMDRRVFHDTRFYENTPRWALAVNDYETDMAHMMADFSCATDIVLTSETAPALARLMTRAGNDTSAETSMAKQHFKRLRPFLIDQGPICQPAGEVENTYDYPSGHTTRGWTWAILLAELMPDRAGEILARGRAFGQSRIVCGVHNASAVEAGRISASATLAVMHGSPAFQADMIAARQELMTLAATGEKPDAGQCRAESTLVHMDLFNGAPPQ
jgi:acid phosphatase (class A)